MDITKTQVFKIKDGKIEEAKNEQEFVERDVQRFYETHLDTLLDATFIASEYAFEGGRIDTFAIDSDNRPVIIEYKRDTKDSVLLQALFYKNFIRNNWEKVYISILEKKGREVADAVDWANIRVVLVAQHFDKWTVASTSFLDGIELYRFAFYDGQKTFLQEFLNENKKASKLPKSQKQSESRKIDEEAVEASDYPSVAEVDYSKDPWVVSNSGKEYKTNYGRFSESSDDVKKLYQDIVDYIYDQYDQLEIVYNKDYWFFKSKKKFIEIIFHKKYIHIQLDLSKETFDAIELDKKDLSKQGHWGTLLSLVEVNPSRDLDKIKKLIDESFERTN